MIELAGYAVVIFAVIYRYRHRSNTLERQQTKWVVFGTLVMLIVAGLNVVAGNLFQSVDGFTAFYRLYSTPLLSIVGLIMPVFFCIAVLRYHLWNIDVIINRTLVYMSLTCCVVSTYMLIVVSSGTLLQQAQGNFFISLFATGIIAIGFQPLRDALQRSVNRLMFGERDDPYRVLTRLGQRLGATLAPESVLPTITETVAQALKLPYVAITLKREAAAFEIASVHGQPLPNQQLTRIPLLYQQEDIGELVLAPRSQGETLNMADQRLLSDLAHEIGVAVHAMQLHIHLQQATVDLQRSRERLVVTREEERRRLRRDLHDGLGPTLAGLTLTTSTIVDLIETDPSTALMLANRLQEEIRLTISDVRRLVYELRPPALDEPGLVAAIRERVEYYQAHVHRSSVTRPTVTIEAPEHLPDLPAAVEVAAFRIMQEAMTNVLRHAQARTCIIRLEMSDVLQVKILDDGIGLPAGCVSGVGLLSIRERVEELGGSCTIERRPTGGTCIFAQLPLKKE
ncbi:integral membrane sensor signal transduction histidine kinase [Ktedonobacter racemifer DSM 44963]|uniref:Integral membrane sensor signal transduction histidine kinase n=1 Tax=Ktedonobacter racemifer DSM 44963 TaxID=485913 RepID=D6TDI5_KTERA|nr:integral membrane sensor signal transduction histidine kinase [Ktedonobacter racemifer DSM 44963]